MGGCIGTIMTRNINEFKSLLFWRAVFTEFFGTFILVFIGCSSIIDWDNRHPANLIEIALCFGFLIAALVSAIGSVSGCHINPAVTVSMLITRRICLGRAILYIIVQCLGGIAGARMLAYMIPSGMEGRVAAVEKLGLVSAGDAMLMEFFITFVLVFTVFACIDEGKSEYKSSGPLMIGLSVSAGVFTGGHYSGACMNPARALGPAVVANFWDYHWIYWCGPILGAIVAALMYDLLFDTMASTRKFKEVFSNVSYDPKTFHHNNSTKLVNVTAEETLEEIKPLRR